MSWKMGGDTNEKSGGNREVKRDFLAALGMTAKTKGEGRHDVSCAFRNGKKNKKAKSGGSTHRQGLAHTKDGHLKVAATKALIGIGGVVTHSPLPHDRTCGSASGGSAGRTNHEQ
jgi:hypothetical protein